MAEDRRVDLLQEAGALGELAALHRAPVFYGRGVPRGDGRTVLVVPGLFGNDMYLQTLRAWLARIGYRPVQSSLLMNAGCPDRLRTTVETSLKRTLDRRPGPVSLIGHSRGGMLCWAIASRLQEQAAQLILLGSPAPAVVRMMKSGVTKPPVGMAPSAVVDAGARALKLMDPDCTVPACGCPYTEDLRRPLHAATRVLSIASRDDQIVPPGACRVEDGANVENIEVRGTHGGLVYNRAVYPHLARVLAETPTR
jgi:pimeloyl-ACP methyl ester carboxylesterase